MTRNAIVLAVALTVSVAGSVGCKSKTRTRVLTPEGSGSAVAITDGSGSAASGGDDLQKAADASAAAFERWVAQWIVVANSYDGKDCNAFVAQLKTLEPKLRDFTAPLMPYMNDTKRMLAIEDLLKTKVAAVEGRMADPALGEKFKTAVQACEKHPGLKTALDRGMMRKPKAAAAGSGSAS